MKEDLLQIMDQKYMAFHCHMSSVRLGWPFERVWEVVMVLDAAESDDSEVLVGPISRLHFLYH
jgi:hypothetical protein